MDTNAQLITSDQAQDIMDANAQPITSDQARTILLECYRKGRDGSFAQFLLRQVQDPVQPRDEKTQKPRLHPVLVATLLLGAIAFAIFLYFSFSK